MENDKVIKIINNCIDYILNEKNLKDMCHKMLQELLQITQNRMGFIGELKYTDAGSPFFRYKAVVFKSEISSFNEYYKKHFLKNDNLDLYNMNTLYGLVYKNRSTVISNDVQNDPRRGGKPKLPKEHPQINKFMGIPLIHNDNLLGMIGLSEPTDGRDYTDDDLSLIEPFCKLFVFAFVYWKRRDAINSTRNHFLLHMSHEIKTPLNGIIGMTQAFLDTDLTPEHLDIIKIISKCNLRLLTIVNDIGDFYKITVGQIELNKKPVSIRSIVEESYRLYAEDLKIKGLTFKYDIEEGLRGDISIDKKRLLQILNNLLSNSINNTDKGGISIRIYKDDIRKDKLIDEETDDVIIAVEVKDTGIGIPKDKIEAITHDFNNLEDYLVVNPETGRGLGLSVCSMLIKLLGGDIEINSIVNSGTIVTFSFRAEITDNVDAYKNAIKHKMEGNYMLVLVNDTSDRLKLSNLIISLGIIPIIPNTVNEAMIYINYSHISFDVIIASDEYLGSDIIIKARTKFDEVYLIGVSENTKYPFVDSYVSINFTQNDIIKQLYAFCNNKYNMDMVIDAQENLVNDMHNDMNINDNDILKLNKMTDNFSITGNNQIEILIAEDEIANQKVLNTSLMRLGYNNIDIVTNGKDMVEYAIKKHYDIIFIDIRMPIMNGLQATEKVIKYYDLHEKTYPFMIAVTALEDLNMQKKYSSIGINYILKKPFHFNSVEKIMNIVKSKKKTNNKHYLEFKSD